MSQRVYVTFNANEWKLLTEKSKEFGFSPSQMVLYMVRGELGIPKTNTIPPVATLQKEQENYLRIMKSGETLYVSTPFADRWWDFDTSTKRALATHLKKLEEKGLCEKTGKKLPNGTNQYRKR